MNFKNIFVLIFTSVFILVICFIWIISQAFSEWGDGFVGKSEEIKKSSLGDEFLFKYETYNFPHIYTRVTVMDDLGKEKITYFVIDGEFCKPDIVTIIDSPEIRCYELYGELIYRIKKDSFKGMSIFMITEYDPKDYPSFIEVAEELVANNEWKWIEACGKFLLKADNAEMKNTLERYALGQFSKEELELNENSEITKEEMQDFAIQTLEDNT
ncbi:hypothetical protein [Anaerovorax odorimutans]|uniref:hypothetical protein n=1 Tax=Anaerovorax odorimutans TaxID=109327 RepID=UPI00042A0BAE|nr:hypothetical protein [Anaerovorax odorimutans]